LNRNILLYTNGWYWAL